MTVAEIVNWEIPKTALLLIDEIETSLHPRAQRRLVRDLAEIARVNDVQIIITTHSPYVLEELPERARIQVSQSDGEKVLLQGVSPFFAMTKMDDAAHHEVEIFVEDEAAKALVEEVIAQRLPQRSATTLVSPCGPASVGKALGQMTAAKRFSRPTAVFLDGDQDPSPGCDILPGCGVAPEVYLFEAFKRNNYGDLPEKMSRSYSEVSEAMVLAMTVDDHHRWVEYVSDRIRLPKSEVWQAICSSWVRKYMTDREAEMILTKVEDLYASK